VSPSATATSKAGKLTGRMTWGSIAVRERGTRSRPPLSTCPLMYGSGNLIGEGPNVKVLGTSVRHCQAWLGLLIDLQRSAYAW
jgi:hypothetical protein